MESDKPRLLFNNNISEYTVIAQYIPLEYFLDFLTSKKYYISRKHEFSDIREKYLPFSSMIIPTEANGDNSRPIDMITVQTNELKRQKLVEQYRQSINLGVSCWTRYEGEDVFMWKEYAKKYGVCIVSTAEKFISEFSRSEFKIHCVPIIYKGYNFSCNLEDCLQRKESCYRNEREIRFYFEENDSVENIELDFPRQPLRIECTPDNFIDKVIVSPYLPGQIRMTLERFLRDKYGLNIIQSQVGRQ